MYYGFIQFRDRIIELVDSTDHIEDPVQEELSPARWLGAYYYALIESEMGDYTMYTLLGWKGYKPDTRMRVVEPFMIRNGVPVFGAQVFSFGDDSMYRVVFEYAARVSMNLVYELHIVQGADGKVPVIAFDRLSPIEERYTGRYAFYVPEANIVDAFVFRNGKWAYVADIDARNPRRLSVEE